MFERYQRDSKALNYGHPIQGKVGPQRGPASISSSLIALEPCSEASQLPEMLFLLLSAAWARRLHLQEVLLGIQPSLSSHSFNTDTTIMDQIWPTACFCK